MRTKFWIAAHWFVDQLPYVIGFFFILNVIGWLWLLSAWNHFK